MNRWKLTEELKNEYLPVIKNFINKLESIDPEESRNYLKKDFSDTKLNPSKLKELLEILGYEETDMDTNGWEWDFWITMSKEGYKDISINGCGMTFELLLSETEV